MAKRFNVGDHVSWNSEAGRVSGRIARVHAKDVDWRPPVPTDRGHPIRAIATTCGRW
jgi:hypothetical protein